MTTTLLSTQYMLINPADYQPYLPGLCEKLATLQDNHVSYFKEIHRESRFAICHFRITHDNGEPCLEYDAAKSRSKTVEKKTHTPPQIMNCPEIQGPILQFLKDINDTSVNHVEAKLIQTETFPFAFDPHRDSQFSRLKRIKYLATLIVSASGIEGGNMQLFHSENDKFGPFNCIEELPCEAGVGYIVDELPKQVFHGMRKAIKTEEGAHRAAFLLRFFE